MSSITIEAPDQIFFLRLLIRIFKGRVCPEILFSFDRSQSLTVQPQILCFSRWSIINIMDPYLPLFALLTVYKTTSSEDFHHFAIYNQNRIGQYYTEIYAQSIIHCSAVCSEDDICRSANFNRETGQCQLSNVSGFSIYSSLIADIKWLVSSQTGEVCSDALEASR